MITISFVHNKGGTGKTTNCANIAGWVHKFNKKVMVIDLDPQGSATSNLGIDKNKLDSSIFDLFVDKEISEIILQTDYGIHLAPANSDLMGAEILLSRSKNRFGFLKEKLAPLEKYYDFVFIDTPPGPGLLLLNGLVASDYCFICLDTSVFAVEGIHDLETLIEDLEISTKHKIDILGIIIGRYMNSFINKLLKTNAPSIYTEKKARVYNSNILTVPYDLEVWNAQLKGLPLAFYKPDSRASQAYRRIAEKIL